LRVVVNNYLMYDARPMANPTPHTMTKTTTERLAGSRDVKADTLARELLWVAIVCREGIWPAWRSAPAVPQKTFPELLHIDSPAGRIVYRLAVEEIPMFEHLELRDNDHEECTGGDKMARLLHLATEGW
jgi:hypothetical protein